MSDYLKKRYKKFRRAAAITRNAVSTFYLKQVIFKGRFLRLHNMLQLAAWLTLVYLLELGFCETILLGGRIGAWYLPCVVSYLAVLQAARFALHRHKYKREFRALVGEEEYYKIYPRDLDRDIRRLERSISLWEDDEEETMDLPLSLDRPLSAEA